MWSRSVFGALHIPIRRSGGTLEFLHWIIGRYIVGQSEQVIGLPSKSSPSLRRVSLSVRNLSLPC
jgi:hypothetical protein